MIVVGLLDRYKDQRPYPVFLIQPEDTASVRPWTVNPGLYNIVRGLFGVIGVVVLVNSGQVTAGRTVVALMCIGQAIAGAVPVISERRLWLSGIAQAFPPIVILWLMFAT